MVLLSIDYCYTKASRRITYWTQMYKTADYKNCTNLTVFRTPFFVSLYIQKFLIHKVTTFILCHILENRKMHYKPSFYFFLTTCLTACPPVQLFFSPRPTSEPNDVQSIVDWRIICFNLLKWRLQLKSGKYSVILQYLGRGVWAFCQGRSGLIF